MDVQAHKQHAQALERKGKTARAITAYRQILDHLDGTEGLLREVPLFVKVADLCFDEDDKNTALAMYDRAAQLYAEYGSGKSVIAICKKILKVLPEATNTHVHYARLMVEGEYIAEARKVLINYAQLFDLPKVQRALDSMGGRSKSEMATILEMVIEMADLGMPEPDSEEDPGLLEIAELNEEGQGEDGFVITKGTTDMLDDRPVARHSLITGDIASEIDKSDGAESEGEEGDSFVVRSGEDWEIEESSVDGGEEDPAIAAPEIPTVDAPPPTAAHSDLPNLDLGQPPADKLMTMEGLVSIGDQGTGDISVDRFSDDRTSGTFRHARRTADLRRRIAVLRQATARLGLAER